LETLYSKLEVKNFEIPCVSLDKNHTKMSEAIIKNGLPWIQIIDEKGFYRTLVNTMKLKQFPYVYYLIVMV
jgi:hypothetical protein